VIKLLFDQNISYRIVRLLKSEFSGCKHVSDVGLNDEEDPEIWNYAKRNGFVIVTFDSDFYEISLINGFPPKIIWIRSGNLATQILANILSNNKTLIEVFINDASSAFLELY